MNRLYFHKNVKQGKKTNPPHANVKESKKTEKVSPQNNSAAFSFLSANEKLFSSPRANHAPSQLIIQESQKKGQGEKKKFLGGPVQNKKDHVRTLNESFINLIMVDGKKSKAEKIFFQALKKLTDHLQINMKKESGKQKEITFFDKKENHNPLLHFVQQDRLALFSERGKKDKAKEKSKQVVVTQHMSRVSMSYTEGSLLILRSGIDKGSVHDLIQKAIDNVKPTLQVRKVRVARSIYQVPFIMKRKRQERCAIRWIIENAKKKSRHSGSTFPECLAQVVLEAFMGQGQVREKRDQIHRIAEANRTYLRYRWW